jgi:hypothetical protein
MSKKFKLKKSDKKKWVKALRSEKYKQGKFQLFDGNGYCCLGVACEIGLAIPEQDNINGSFVNKKFVPIEVQRKLANFNDGDDKLNIKPKSFKWIANYIERYL